MTVVATAGHVDHGKSTLVQVLTGIDPDRWAEEKERGLTIDLGFAAMEPGPDGVQVEFVDVPGHTRFLRNMLAGVGAISRCLFVVAADDGWMPQSEEHLRILEALGVSDGVIALTKVDRVDDETAAMARQEIAERVAATFLADAPVIAVSAPTGRGITELRAALAELVARPESRETPPRARLWVDRCFAARGAGTVVTGTLTGGPLSQDDRMEIAPAGLSVRIRGLEHHGRSVPEIGPGHRVAVNLSGVTHDAVRRGDALVEPGRWHHTEVVDAGLDVLSSLTHPVSRRASHVCYLGSGEFPVRLRVLGPDELAPGAAGLVRLRLPRALPLQPGDRFVLRDAGRDETVGGGEILDVDPVLAPSRARPDRSLDRLVAERGVVEAATLERLCGWPVSADLGPYRIDPLLRERWTEELRRAVAASPQGLALAELDDVRRLLLGDLDDVTVEDGVARPAGAADDPELAAVLELLDADPFAPPDLGPDRRGAVARLKRQGLVREQDGVVFSVAAVEAAAAVVAGLLADREDGFTVAEARTAWGNSRKHAVPLLEVLDTLGVTRRRGDRRVAGPRLPSSGGSG